MSRDIRRPAAYARPRGRDWERGPPDYRNRSDYDKNRLPRMRSRSPTRRDNKHRSDSMQNSDKDLLDDNILSEISKLPEPSELWDNQFQDSGFAPPPPRFTEAPRSGGNYGQNFQPPYSNIYDDFHPISSVPPTGHPPHPSDMPTWNQVSVPPAPAPPSFVNNVEDQIKKEAAIESEMRHQRAALSKQREDYKKKLLILKKELDTLKDQRNELRGDSKRSPSPDTKRFLKENTKLQLEIQNKLKTINNVVDMLNGIIGEDGHTHTDNQNSDSESAERASTKRKSRSPSLSQKFNYVYYDPEMHWCRVCNEFPSTAKDYLNHLHSAAHTKMAAAHMEAPWHSVSGINEGFPNHSSAPTKRTPIKGLQFFVPSTAWYCKLCDQFIGDLHCASAHLKSIVHAKNFANFVEQNPHWETDWMSDRQRAFEKSRQMKAKQEKMDDKPQYTAHTITFNKDGFHTKTTKSPTQMLEHKKKKKDKKKKNKKKKESSSSSCSSSSSDNEPAVKKKKLKAKKDKLKIHDLVTAIKLDRLNDNDRKLLDNLKNRIKSDDVESKRRSIERDRSARQREISRDDQRKRDKEGSRWSPVHREECERRSPSQRRASPPRAELKKPEIKKMPFIGKMPVYKNLNKNIKVEDQKKEEEKKKEEEETTKKKREEMDAEIQKKVAEFKEKIAKAQLEREHVDLPPPTLVLPTQLGAGAAPPFVTQQLPPAQTPSTQPSGPALPKDFQDALDIIFPAEVKEEVTQPDLFPVPNLGPSFPMSHIGGVMPTFPPFLQPQMPQMFSFDVPPLFPPSNQLYDAHVPMVTNVPNTNPRQRNPNQNTNNKHMSNQMNIQNKPTGNKTAQNLPTETEHNKENGSILRKKEELDDLAMLGIDASDVGAGI